MQISQFGIYDEVFKHIEALKSCLNLNKEEFGSFYVTAENKENYPVQVVSYVLDKEGQLLDLIRGLEFTTLRGLMEFESVFKVEMKEEKELLDLWEQKTGDFYTVYHNPMVYQSSEALCS